MRCPIVSCGFFLLAQLAFAETTGEPVERMVAGIRAYLRRATEESIAHRKPDREELRRTVGAIDTRVKFTDLELVASTAAPALAAETAGMRVLRVRWPVLDGVTAEGLYFQP